MGNYPQVARDDILAARERISGSVERTPLIESRIRGQRIWLKCECLQTGGSFKLRGATNRLMLLDEQQRRRGVVAFSSGNHAQGVAIAAERLGIHAIIVMPADAPAKKIEGTRSHGAEIIFYDRATENREEIAARLGAEKGSVVVPSFDDPHIVAGQGTAGLEIIDQLGASPAQILVNCGGGGLSSGLALACPDAAIVTVEPEGWDDMRKSLEVGEIVPVGPNPPPTLCDAIQTLRVSPLTLGILKDRDARGVAVSEEETVAAVRWAWQEHELVVEPGAAVSMAALLSGKVEIIPETVALVSGGNIDPALHARLVS
ncbi:threonine/serine dehydratase [Sphingomonas sp. RB56-2]|uniref:Threonine/serine dehydratase n=1 Tax=Sphingomonas brevis TaxID=2908206 RepID=A0ABT0S7Y4_9SPHN|nr:threonine/serine dehydratase [Sphingomonas brevis]MCL6740255.1 threonine/serine dehydratase [Sphingomonas brevis]